MYLGCAGVVFDLLPKRSDRGSQVFKFIAIVRPQILRKSFAWGGASPDFSSVVNHSGYLVLYPNAGGLMWWDAKVSEEVHSLLLEVLRAYNVDTNRVYLTGISHQQSQQIKFGWGR
jgi:hypothetical protein